MPRQSTLAPLTLRGLPCRPRVRHILYGAREITPRLPTPTAISFGIPGFSSGPLWCQPTNSASSRAVEASWHQGPRVCPIAHDLVRPPARRHHCLDATRLSARCAIRRGDIRALPRRATQSSPHLLSIPRSAPFCFFNTLYAHPSTLGMVRCER